MKTQEIHATRLLTNQSISLSMQDGVQMRKLQALGEGPSNLLW